MYELSLLSKGFRIMIGSLELNYEDDLDDTWDCNNFSLMIVVRRGAILLSSNSTPSSSPEGLSKRPTPKNSGHFLDLKIISKHVIMKRS